MANFRINEIAIGQNINSSPEYNGMECEVICGLQKQTVRWSDGRLTHDEPVYEVTWANGETLCVRPNNLRKRHEPGNWEDLKDEFGKPIWNPGVMV